MKKTKKKTGRLTRILKALYAKFGAGAPKGGLALKPKAVCNVVAEENYMPTTSSRSLAQQTALLTGMSTSDVCSEAVSKHFAKLATKPSQKLKRRNGQKLEKRGN